MVSRTVQVAEGGASSGKQEPTAVVNVLQLSLFHVMGWHITSTYLRPPCDFPPFCVCCVFVRKVITTDRRLVSDGPWEFELLSEREGKNAETGGKSIAYLWRVVKSAL